MRKDEIIKTLLELQISILETVSKPSVEEEKEKKEVSPTRNEMIEENTIAETIKSGEWLNEMLWCNILSALLVENFPKHLVQRSFLLVLRF